MVLDHLLEGEEVLTIEVEDLEVVEEVEEDGNKISNLFKKKTMFHFLSYVNITSIIRVVNVL